MAKTENAQSQVIRVSPVETLGIRMIDRYLNIYYVSILLADDLGTRDSNDIRTRFCLPFNWPRLRNGQDWERAVLSYQGFTC